MSYNPNNPNGSATSANSAPVVIASDQSSIPVAATITGTPTISGSVSVSNFPATQPVSAVALPLPTGAATSALQTAGNSTLSTINTTLGSPFQAGGSIGNTSFGISGSLPAGSNALGSVSVSNFPSTQPISATSLPLPTGAATAANQSSIITALGSPFQAGGSIGNTTFASTQSGTWNLNNIAGTISLPTGAATAALQSTINTTLGSPFQAGGSIGNTSFGATQSGTWNITNISGTVSLPTGASTAANQATMITALNSIEVGTPNSLGQLTMANSSSVAIASDQTNIPTILPDMYVTGASAQTALVNNILTTTSGTAATDLGGYRSASVQVTSTGTGGAFIFEASNDNVNFQAIPVYNQLILTGTPITSAITVSASQLIYTFPITARYNRLRISTAITGGSIQAFSRFSQAGWTPAVVQVVSNTGANLNANVSTVATVNTLTNGNLGFPGQITDVTSAAIVTTTTTAAYTPTYGTTYQINIPVTAVSGTSPTMDVEVQESRDGGTNWVAIYDFPRISSIGSYNSPMLPLTGNKVRYVQVIGGATPSFTRAINRLQESFTGATFIRQIVDRTVSLTTLSSTTAVLNAEQETKNVMLTINIGAATGAPALQIQASDDAGATWYSIGSPLTAVASSTVSSTITNVTAQQYRAIVTTAGTGVTAGYVLVRAF